MQNNDQIQISTVSSKKVLMISIILGALAAILNILYLSDFRKTSITVYKATRTIKAGELFLESDKTPVEINGDFENIKNLAITQKDINAFVNIPIAETINKGDLLLTRSFQLTGDGGLREGINREKNERAVTFSFTDESQENFLHQGDMVDVWGNIADALVPIAKNVCVKAVGKDYIVPEKGNNSSSHSVTVFITENKVGDMLSNIELTKNNIKLTLSGACDPNAKVSIEPKIKLPEKNNSSTEKSTNIPTDKKTPNSDDNATVPQSPQANAGNGVNR